MIHKFLSFSPSKDYYSIFFGWILSATGFGILLPFIAIYFTDKFSLSITDIGYFFLMSSILRAIFQAYGGELSDTLGRKNIILFALFGRAFFLILLFIFDLFFFNLIYMLIFLGLTYMFSAIFMPVTQAAIADLVPENKYLEAYSIIRIGGNLGWIFGPILGGWVYEFSKSFYFLFSAIFSILGGFIFLFSFSNSNQLILRNKEKSSYISIFKNRLFIFFCIISFFMMLTSSQLLSSLPYFLKNIKHIETSYLGYIFSINGITVILVQYPILKIIQKINPFIGMFLGSLLYGLSYSLVGLLNNIWEFLIIIFLISVAETIVLPLVQSAIVNISSRTTYGRYMGFFGIISVTGWSVGPMIGTQIIGYIKDPILSWIYIASFSILSSFGFICFYYIFSHKKNK